MKEFQRLILLCFHFSYFVIVASEGNVLSFYITPPDLLTVDFDS